MKVHFFLVKLIRMRMEELGYNLEFASDDDIIRAARQFAAEIEVAA